MKKIYGYFSVTLLLVSNLTYASDLEKEAVYRVSKNYGTSIACNTTFTPDDMTKKINTTSKSVLTLESDPQGSSTYLVFWGGDMACAGGSGTYRNNLTEIGRDTPSREFTVRAESVLHVEDINPRFIEKVTLSPNKHLIVDGGEIDENGVYNGPSKRYRYELAQVDGGDWKVVKRTYLGKYN